MTDRLPDEALGYVVRRLLEETGSEVVTIRVRRGEAWADLGLHFAEVSMNLGSEDAVIEQKLSDLEVVLETMQP